MDATTSRLDAAHAHVAYAFKHNSPLIACRFHPEQPWVYFAGQDNRVWRWAWQESEAAAVPVAEHGSWIRALACTPDGQWLLTGGYDGRLAWWPASAEQPQSVRHLEAHRGWIRALACSHDGTRVATAGNDHLVKVWDAEQGELLQTLKGHTAHVYNVTFHPGGEALVSGDLKGELIHWDSDGNEARRLKVEAFTKYDTTFRADIGGFRGLAFDAAGERLAGSSIVNVTNAFAGVGNPAVAELDWESGQLLVQHEAKQKLNGVAWNLAFHPLGWRIAVSGGSSGGFLLFWRAEDKEEFHQFKLPNPGRDMDLAAEGEYLATAHYDRHLRITRLAPAG